MGSIHGKSMLWREWKGFRYSTPPAAGPSPRFGKRVCGRSGRGSRPGHDLCVGCAAFLRHIGGDAVPPSPETPAPIMATLFGMVVARWLLVNDGTKDRREWVRRGVGEPFA